MKQPTTAGWPANKETRFVQRLLHWNQTANHRQMPWKGEKDPYRIWISEIILQQTRVDQGLAYYQRFIEKFPTVQHLAGAADHEVFKAWEGLGYYSRCKNLLASARFIVSERKGVFPSDYQAILQLKGVGGYTAAAIASFAFNQPYAVLDGNVFRVLARIFGLAVPVDTAAGKKTFETLAQRLVPEGQAGTYNQAIMDFGATVCKPTPLCPDCFFSKYCYAYLMGQQQSLPVKKKQAALRNRWFHYVVFRKKGTIAVQPRQGKDIWQHLYEFPHIETAAGQDILAPGKLLKEKFGLQKGDYTLLSTTARPTQKLSHQKIHFQFTVVELKKEVLLDQLHFVPLAHLNNLPFPKTLKSFITDELGL